MVVRRVGGPVAEDDRSPFARKPIEQAIRDTQTSSYRRVLGPVDLTGLGIAAIIGAGIFVTTGRAAAETGSSIILSYVIAGLACIFAAFAFAELASMVPGSGSAYTFAFVSLGRMPAFLMAWLLVLEYVVGNMFVANSWAGYLSAALADAGLPLPQALRVSFLEEPGGFLNLPAVLITIVATVLVILGVRESVRTGNVLVAFKLLVVLFVIFAGLSFVRPANLSDFAPGGPGGIATAAAVVFFGYIGFDTVAAIAEEARNPRRDLPIAIVGSLVACMVLYGAVSLVFTGMVPRDQIDQDAPLASAFEQTGMAFASPLITIGALVATFTVLLAFMIGLPRIFQAVARDGLLPQRFAAIHPRFRIPLFTAVVGGIVTVVGAGFLPGTVALDLTNLGTLAIYVLVCLGVLVLRRTMPDAERPFRTPLILPVLGIVFCLGLMFFLDVASQLYFVMWVGLGLVLYAVYSWLGRSAYAPER